MLEIKKQLRKVKWRVMYEYNCKNCGRLIVTFTEEKMGRIKECLRCKIHSSAQKP